MTDSNDSGEQAEIENRRDTALKLLRLNLTIATVFVAGITFGISTPNWEHVRPFLNGSMVLGGVSTVLALLVVVETTFTESAGQTGWLHDRLAGVVGVTVVVTGWSLPLFAIGVFVGLYGGWDLPTVLWGLIVLMVLLHLVPTWYVLWRSYFARFGYPSQSPQGE